MEDNGQIQYTAPTNPGNSGGPLVDADGQVLGIVQLIRAGAQNINFAIPTYRVSSLLEQWKKVPNQQRQVNAYNFLGLVQIYKQNYQTAIALFNQGIALNAETPALYSNRGQARVYLKDYQGALEDYNRSIQLRPTSIAYFSRARIRQTLQNRKGAIEDYTQAINLNQNWGTLIPADALYARGLIQGQQGDKAHAIADFQKAADLYERQGKKEQYQKAIDQIIRLNSKVSLGQ